MAIALFILGGILTGGAISLVKQHASRFSIAVVWVLAMLALAAGVVWLIPGDG